MVGHAQVATRPEKRPHPRVSHSEKDPWVFRVQKEQYYLSEPVVIDVAPRGPLAK